MKIKFFILAALCMATISIYAQNFNGLDMNMGNLYRLSNAKTRSISPENFTGEKGKGGMADPITDKEKINQANAHHAAKTCLLYTSPSPRDRTRSRMPSSA